MERRVVISGCSGGGKSTLLETLRERGYAVVEEPGRRIVREQLASDGSALPWVDLAAFARAAISTAISDWEANAESEGWVFFDRGLVDAASALEHATGDRVLDELGRSYSYHRRVLLTPPWPEIYGQDEERQHDLEAAAEEYDRLLAAYPALGYEVTILPKTGVAERADFVFRMLEADEPSCD